MKMKRILGLDLGTNSIGWALIEIDHKNGTVKIIGLGSRILPMDAGEINDFEGKGKIKSAAAQRTEKRGPKRLNERFLLRRDRLHLVLNLLGALPDHYNLDIDFTNNKGEKCGQFKPYKEPKLAYLPKQKGQKAEFLFKESYQEMLDELGLENKKGKRIPYDWTLYYLRQKALEKEISIEELAWVLLSYNQKRGYEKTEVEDKSTKENEVVEKLDLMVKEVLPMSDEKGKYYKIHLDGNDDFVYKEYSKCQMTFEGDLKEVEKKSKIDIEGNIEKYKTMFTIFDIYSLEIKKINYKKELDNNLHKYTLTYQNGWQETKQHKEYTFKYKNASDKSFDYIVETLYDYKGEIKLQKGKDRTLKEPNLSDSSNDWTLLKKKTEKDALCFNIEKKYSNDDGSAKKYISPKIYNTLKENAKTGNRTKIIGGMFQVVDRDFYREELKQIVSTQKEFHKNLVDSELFKQCVKRLYPKNESHRKTLLANKSAIQHLLVEDILLYQRPLKSKKSEISNCKYEIKYWKKVNDKKTKRPVETIDKETEEITTKKQAVFHKVVSASHPYFQEFRIWDKLHNLKLIQLEKKDESTNEIKTNVDITKEVFKSKKDYQKLFDLLNNRKHLSQEDFLKYCKKEYKIPYDKKKGNYVWNFPEKEEIKGNETRVSFVTRFKRCGLTDTKFLTQKNERDLWHYLYSVSYKERTANNNKSATTFFNGFLDKNTPEEVKEKIIKDFVNYPKFDSKYCAYSEKALKKLIPLIEKGETNMRDSWNTKELYKEWHISFEKRKEEILKRLKKIDFNQEKINYSEAVDTNATIPFPKGLFNAFKKFEKVEDFTNIDLTKASYLVYGRHSELAQAMYWKSPKEITDKLHQELKQHSLNNPVAEKVILEMMQIVAEIWKYYGKKKEGSDEYEELFHKIHLEVGRELKKTAKEKEAYSKRMKDNNARNKRIRQILEEFLKNTTYNAEPKNNGHFERLKIIEEGAEHSKNTDKNFFDNKIIKAKKITKKNIEDILKKPKISKQDFEKYKLWAEQGYKSPYTNRTIKFTDLFNGNKYNIDHVFPQVSVTNNSLSNKVVCETEVNNLKSDQTGREFVNDPREREIYCSSYKSKVKIVDDDTYVKIVRSQFSGNKKNILLSKDIPKGFTSSQLNNARHISRKAMELLSHIVREKGEMEFRSKNVLPVTGRITSELKKVWKLNEVWTELLAPRFKRMNKLTGLKLFGDYQTSKSGHKYFDCKPDEFIREKDKSYDIKRIDHKHHALDALIVALCTEEHLNYINNINANTSSENFGKQKQIEKYRQTLKRKIMYSVSNKEKPKNNDWHYIRPGGIRQKDAKNSREDSVLVKQYSYGDKKYGSNWKKMVLEALQDTIVTFKQNLRVINKTINKYSVYIKDKNGNYTGKKNRIVQKGESAGNKTNWAIRRSLSKETYYGRVNLKLKKKKKLYSLINTIYTDISVIVDKELKDKIKKLRKDNDLKTFKKEVKKRFKNKYIDCYYFTEKIASREFLSTKFNSEEISKITDTGIQKILYNHLKQFDTVEIPFDKGIKYFDSLLEVDEFEGIVNDSETNFKANDDLIDFLEKNQYKYNKTDYSKLNVFINKVSGRDFRNEEDFKDKIKEHPEIAFTPETIEDMNESDNLKRLNKGKRHTPIRKVRVSEGLGKQRALNGKNKESVKSKQYVVNDAGSNLYIGFYERTYRDENGKEKRERQFKNIGLIDLIEILKQGKGKRANPLPDKVYDKKKNEYDLIFTLSPLDLVFVPVEEEIENPSLVDFNNLSKEQLSRIYKHVNHSGKIANFIPHSVSRPIWDSNCNEILIKDEFGLGSPQTKNQNMIDGKTQIKKICWKLKTDRLGNISKV